MVSRTRGGPERQLPRNWAFNQIQTLTVDEGGPGEVEIHKDIVSGRDLGISGSTMPTPPNHASFAWLDALQALAEQWAEDHPDSDDPNLLVLQYIRFPNYGSGGGNSNGNAIGWAAIAGAVDSDRSTYPDTQGLEGGPG